MYYSGYLATLSKAAIETTSAAINEYVTDPFKELVHHLLLLVARNQIVSKEDHENSKAALDRMLNSYVTKFNAQHKEAGVHSDIAMDILMKNYEEDLKMVVELMQIFLL